MITHSLPEGSAAGHYRNRSSLPNARLLVWTALLVSGWLGGLPSVVAAQEEAAADGGSDSGYTYRYDSGYRLALQARYAQTLTIAGKRGEFAAAPFVTAGLRMLDERLFVGLGFGLHGVNDGGGSGFSLSPVVTFDLLTDRLGALYVGGWVNLGSVSQPGPSTDVFFFGANVLAGVRGKLSKSVSFGVEWGWEFAWADVPAESFAHGIFGAVVLEASVGL